VTYTLAVYGIVCPRLPNHVVDTALPAERDRMHIDIPTIGLVATAAARDDRHLWNNNRWVVAHLRCYTAGG
jgi:hypothetical protein